MLVWFPSVHVSDQMHISICSHLCGHFASSMLLLWVHALFVPFAISPLILFFSLFSSSIIFSIFFSFFLKLSLLLFSKLQALYLLPFIFVFFFFFLFFLWKLFIFFISKLECWSQNYIGYFTYIYIYIICGTHYSCERIE